MLDIKFLRSNPDVVKQNIKNKFQDEKLPLVDEVIELDKRNREIKQEVEALRAEKNKASKEIGAMMAQKKLEEAEALKKKVAESNGRINELSEEEKEEIMIILRQARRMSKLINEMLMIARGEMSESYDMEEVDLILLTEVIVEELREQAEKKKIQISVSSDRDVKMMGNHTLLLRMMMNLVQNAISYGKEHGHIDILWKEQGDMIIGEVKDDGIGIDQKHLPKIWDRFYRVDKSRSRENGGTGLGLSMVRFIVAVHGGKIRVESKKGEGTSFIFQFPKESIK